MKRYFFPTRPNTTKIHHWEWTKGHGLKVIYKDKIKTKSDWKLNELLSADHTKGDGLPCYEKFIH